MPYVKRHSRRAPKNPDAVLRRADKHLRKLKANKNEKYVCRTQVTEEASQVLPANGLDFQRDMCSIVNIETGDTKNEVRAATTKFHEAWHAKDISKGGAEATTKGHEIKAHRATIVFLEDWEKRDQRKDIQKWIRQEKATERKEIAGLKVEP